MRRLIFEACGPSRSLQRSGPDWHHDCRMPLVFRTTEIDVLRFARVLDSVSIRLDTVRLIVANIKYVVELTLDEREAFVARISKD